MLLKHHFNKFEDILFVIFNITICDKVDSDVKFLHERLIYANGEEGFEYYRLEKHLL